MKKKAADALPSSNWSPFYINPNLPPERADIVIVGGGVMGWSIAYWLKKMENSRNGMRVVVVEKDPVVRSAITLCTTCSWLSQLGLTPHFGLMSGVCSSTCPDPLFPSVVHPGLHCAFCWRNQTAVLSAWEHPALASFSRLPEERQCEWCSKWQSLVLLYNWCVNISLRLL